MQCRGVGRCALFWGVRSGTSISNDTSRFPVEAALQRWAPALLQGGGACMAGSTWPTACMPALGPCALIKLITPQGPATPHNDVNTCPRLPCPLSCHLLLDVKTVTSLSALPLSFLSLPILENFQGSALCIIRAQDDANRATELL